MSVKMALDLVVGGPGGGRRCSSGVTSMVVPGTARMPWWPERGEAVEERALVDEDARLVAVDHVEVEQLGVEEARRAGARHDGPGADRLDVAHRPGQLALDLGPHERLQLAGGQLVDHRVPDRPAVLQPVQVDGAVGAQRVEVGRAAVVLVDDAHLAVADDERRVAARTVGDARLDVDGDGEPAEVELLAVDRCG